MEINTFPRTQTRNYSGKPNKTLVEFLKSEGFPDSYNAAYFHNINNWYTEVQKHLSQYTDDHLIITVMKQQDYQDFLNQQSKQQQIQQTQQIEQQINLAVKVKSSMNISTYYVQVHPQQNLEDVQLLLQQQIKINMGENLVFYRNDGQSLDHQKKQTIESLKLTEVNVTIQYPGGGK